MSCSSIVAIDLDMFQVHMEVELQNQVDMNFLMDIQVKLSTKQFLMDNNNLLSMVELPILFHYLDNNNLLYKIDNLHLMVIQLKLNLFLEDIELELLILLDNNDLEDIIHSLHLLELSHMLCQCN
mgnify:CR=1 FL=1